jgi:hypothetical protein
MMRAKNVSVHKMESLATMHVSTISLKAALSKTTLHTYRDYIMMIGIKSM